MHARIRKERGSVEEKGLGVGEGWKGGYGACVSHGRFKVLTGTVQPIHKEQVEMGHHVGRLRTRDTFLVSFWFCGGPEHCDPLIYLRRCVVRCMHAE